MVRHQQNAVLLPRLLGLRDHSPFILISDSIGQSAEYLIQEFLYRIPKDTNVLFLSFETIDVPPRVNKTIECSGKTIENIQETVRKLLLPEKKNVVFIDSLMFIDPGKYTQFLIPLMSPFCTTVATYHIDIPSNDHKNSFYPSASTLLSYFATSILSVGVAFGEKEDDINKQEEMIRQIDEMCFPTNCNQTTFTVHLTHRRKSGRSLEASYKVKAENHEIEYIPLKQGTDSSQDGSEGGGSGGYLGGADTEEVLKNLTTFNLTTTEQQKKARDKVDLPYLQAQEVGHGGARGGAIIYEFEKEDDYDEEDPYEDPF